MNWETVIGLEVHVQLATESKIFSAAATTFGAPPNSQACALDLAMPGTLPVLNEQALRHAVLFGLGIDAQIHRRSVFDRKNYFYPDLPKGYQISQFTHPIVGRGEVEIHLADGSSKRVGITRAHLEEDAGKSLHEDFHGMSGIDLNRAGTPLLEIVSDPDLRGAEEAVAYLKTIHSLVTSLGVSDGNMAEGSLRCDVNISLRPMGDTELGTRTELKNLNSFRFVEKAIQVEAARQRDILEDGGSIKQETRLYDPDRNETRPMRSKEVANDYRYFPEPDLLPVQIDDAYIEALRAQLPELPRERRQRFESSYGLGSYDAGVLAGAKALADYFEAVVAVCDDAKLAANWVQVEVLGQLNRNEMEIGDCPVTAEEVGTLILRIKDGSISGKIAKQVFEALWGEGGGSDSSGDVGDGSESGGSGGGGVGSGNDVSGSDVSGKNVGSGEVVGSGGGDGSGRGAGGNRVDAIIEEQGLKQVSDSGALDALVQAAVEGNPEQVAQYRAADKAKRKKLLGFFVGQIMQASKGQANPQMVNQLLHKALGD